MATVTVFTSTRMLAIESQAIVAGTVNGSGQLILTRNNGTTITAGSVIGPTGAASTVVGPTGPAGPTGPTGPTGATGAAGTLADNSVSTIKIQDNAVTNAKIAGSITASKVLGAYSSPGSSLAQSITISQSVPSNGTGNNGDIWLRY